MHLLPPYRHHPEHHHQPGDSTWLDLDAGLTIGNARPFGLPLRFGYDTADPFALILDLRAPTGTVTVWRLSRDLVWEGLQQPTGLGDVRIWPPCPCHNRPDLRITLRGRQSTALLDIPAQPVRRWLATRAFALVPQGAEADLIDWDTELNRLLPGPA